MDAVLPVKMEQMSLTHDELGFLYHHIVFPPKLPGHSEHDRTHELFFSALCQGTSRYLF